MHYQLQTITNSEYRYPQIKNLAIYMRCIFLINRDVVESIQSEARRFPETRLLGIIDRIRQTRKNLEVNANPTMAMESLLFEMR